MSKSLGNVVDPLKVIEQMGADVMRLWVASADYRNDLANSPKIMKQVSEAYRKIRNTSRFLLSNLYDFDPAKDRVDFAALPELDRWATHKLQKLIERVCKAYRDYEFHVVYHAIHKFCVVDMSAFYLDIVKDRLYSSLPDDPGRRSAQTVIFDVVSALVRLMAPVLAFTSEELWRYLPKGANAPVSIQLVDMPKVQTQWIDEELAAKWDRILAIRETISKELELARQDKVIGHSLSAAVDIYPVDGETYEFLAAMADQLAAICIVSTGVLHAPEVGAAPVSEGAAVRVVVSPAAGEKCERCWTISTSVGQDELHPTLCARCAAVVRQLPAEAGE